MHFKIFTLSANLKKEIRKAGFVVNSYESYNAYSGTEIELTITSPKDYILQGVIWKPINSSSFSERTYCLAKTPFLSFDELWNLFLNSFEDDKIGALIQMNTNYYKQLKHKYAELKEISNPSKHAKRIIEMIENMDI